MASCFPNLRLTATQKPAEGGLGNTSFFACFR